MALPSSSSEDGSWFDPCVVIDSEYNRSETADWMRKEDVLYWQSLDDTKKQEFLTVPAKDLVASSWGHVRDPWLVDFLQDAIVFFQLHDTWKMFVCPDLACSRSFKDCESLIAHLKCDHFPEFYHVAWPPPRHNLVEEHRFADALCSKLWKPIDVDAALDLLSTLRLHPKPTPVADFYASSDWLHSLNWVFSDDLKRKRLLGELKKGFLVLLAKQERTSISLLSDGLFMTMTALASKHIFVDSPTTYDLFYFRSLLARSPLSFCLLGTSLLSQFVETVKVMCQLVRQHTSCSADRGLGSAEVDISWKTSKILDVLSDSLNAVSGESEAPSNDDWESLLNSLCRVPSLPLIQKIPNKAAGIFSRVQKILEALREEGPTVVSLTQQCSSNLSCNKHLQTEPYCCSGDPNKLHYNESHFKWELERIELSNELLHLESQLCQLCAVNCRSHILLLIGSLLRLKLYTLLKCRGLRVQEGNPAAQRISYQEDKIERKFSSDGSETEYDSDYTHSNEVESDEAGSGDDSESEAESTSDLELDRKPWKNDPIFRRLESTLSDSATGGTEGTGPFFWMAISDVQRYCEKHFGDAEFKSLREGISWFSVNKTWKYWVCYNCGETFTDWETHMMHLEDKHQLCLDYEDCWLIPPQKKEKDVVEELRKNGVKEPALEDSITLDQTFGYFLVDSAKFGQMPPIVEADEHGLAKRIEYMEIIHVLKSELCDLRRIFHKKHEYLTCMEVVNSLDKLSSNDWLTDTTCQLQLQFISELLCETHPSLGHPVQKAFRNMRDGLISKEKFDLDYNLNLGCDKIKDLLASIDNILVVFEDSFRVVVQSPGKVIINTKKNKSLWGVAYIGISLRFVGEWKKLSCPETSEELTGDLKFGGWYNWDDTRHMSFGSVIIHDNEDTSAPMESRGLNLEYYISEAVSDKLLFFQESYVKAINDYVKKKEKKESN